MSAHPVLCACEYSGTLRDAFLDAGIEAISCDLLPSDSARVDGEHYQGDVLDILDEDWSAVFAFPPCTFLTSSAEWAYKDGPYHQKVKPGTLVGAERREARIEAVHFVKTIWGCKSKRVVIENPVGHLSKAFRKPSQIIQPWQYGDNASKNTCLWVRGLPLLKPTELCPPRMATSNNGESWQLRWDNQTDSGQNRLTPSEDRWKVRSTFFPGWAKAMVQQWSDFLHDD